MRLGAHRGDRHKGTILGRGTHPARGRRRTLLALPLLAAGLGVVAVTAASAGAGAASRFSAAGGVTQTTTFTGAKSTSGQLAQSDPSLLGRTDSTPVNVMIKYDFDGTASYAGDVAG